MNETSVGTFDPLRNGVRSIEMVVPEQDQRTDELLASGPELRGAKQRIELRGQVAFGEHAGTRPGPERGVLLCRQEFRDLRRNIARHALELGGEAASSQPRFRPNELPSGLSIVLSDMDGRELMLAPGGVAHNTCSTEWKDCCAE